MKKKLILCFLLFASFAAFSQKVDDIVGYYYSIDPLSKEASQCYIYQADDNSFEAKLTWVENPEKKKFLGLVFMTKLTYNAAENEYQGGVLKYPGKKGTYKTFMKIVSPTQLKVRGYMGISLLGITMYWEKEQSLRTKPKIN